MDRKNIVIRLRTEKGQERLELDSKSKYGKALKIISEKYGIRRSVVQSCLFADAFMEVPFTVPSIDRSLSFNKISNGQLIYLKIPKSQSSSPSDQSKLQKVSDFGPPPTIGPNCKHDKNMRCPECFRAWRRACLVALGKDPSEEESEDLDMPPKGAWGGNTRDTRYFEFLNGRVFNIQAPKKTSTAYVKVNTDCGMKAQMVLEAMYRERQRSRELSRKQGKFISMAASRADRFVAYLFGNVESDHVTVNLIYFTEYQPKSFDKLINSTIPSSRDAIAEQIAKSYGYKRIGTLYSHFGTRGYQGMTSEESIDHARCALKYKEDNFISIIAIVDCNCIATGNLECSNPSCRYKVAFEPFQCGKTLTKMVKRGVIDEEETLRHMRLGMSKEGQVIHNFSSSPVKSDKAMTVDDIPDETPIDENGVDMIHTKESIMVERKETRVVTTAFFNMHIPIKQYSDEYGEQEMFDIAVSKAKVSKINLIIKK